MRRPSPVLECRTMPPSLSDPKLPETIAHDAIGRTARFLDIARSVSVRQASRHIGGLNEDTTTVMNAAVSEQVMKLMHTPDDQVLADNWNVIARRSNLRFSMPTHLTEVQRAEVELCRRAHRKHGTDFGIDKGSIRTVHDEAERYVETQPLLRDPEKEYLTACHARAVIGHIITRTAEGLGLMTVGHVQLASPKVLQENDQLAAVLKEANDMVVEAFDVGDMIAADTVIDAAVQIEHAVRRALLPFGIAPTITYSLAPEDPRRSAFQFHGTIRNAGERVGRNVPCPCQSGKKFKNCCGRPQN